MLPKLIAAGVLAVVLATVATFGVVYYSDSSAPPSAHDQTGTSCSQQASDCLSPPCCILDPSQASSDCPAAKDTGAAPADDAK